MSMSRFRCLLIAGLVCLVLPAALGEAHCPGNVASLTLRLVQSSIIVIPIEINHSGPYDFIVDTGAQVTTVEPRLASELHLKNEGTAGVGGVATFARLAYAKLGLIEAAGHSVANSIVVIQELAQLKTADPRIRGILAANFIEHFDVLIDNGQKIMCLDESGTLAAALKGEHIALAEPRGSQRDLPFTRPILVSASLSAVEGAPVLLRLDSGSNALLLYADDSRLRKEIKNPRPALTRFVNGVEQSFGILPPQDVHVGKQSLKHVSFAMPLNAIGIGPQPREDGLLPTIAFQRVFISCSGGYVSLDPWGN
jgi:hypothetical protein